MGARDGPTLITSVQRAFRLMEAVSAHENGAPAKQLARETGLPLATAYHLLRTLVHDGYVRKLDDGGFILGDKVRTLHTRGRGQELLGRVRPTLAALRDELASAAYLTFYEDGEIRVAEIVDGPRAPRVDLWVGFEDAGHATALGKSVLREMDEETRNDYLARHTLADLTPAPSPAGRSCCAARLVARGPRGHGPGGVRPRYRVCRRARLQRGHTRLARRLASGGSAAPDPGGADAARPHGEPGDARTVAHYLKSRSLRCLPRTYFLDETDISGRI